MFFAYFLQHIIIAKHKGNRTVGRMLTDQSVSDFLRMGDFINQIFVVHKSGIVILSRIYQQSCISSDPQLIGGLLSAMLTLVQHDTNDTRYCSWEMDGRHRLKDIGMSCSRWFIGTHGDFTIATLVPYSSPLITSNRYDIIQKINQAIIASFSIFIEFGTDGINGKVEAIQDYTIEFGNTLDSLIFESLYDNLGIEIGFEKGKHYDVQRLV
ncbi:MAG: hypothetical protein D6732_07115 [Methanobacteriota archaeon]|nr:MAG: hypothetical protein D6732_07115 [Euryarchaeota archaeon]